MLLQFSTTWEPVKFNAQAILTSLTGATTILIQLSSAGLIPGLMLMQLSPPTMAHSILLMQLSPTTLDHDQFSCNFQLVPTKFCNAHLMKHYNYHQIRWILSENWLRINISLLLGVYAKNFSTYWPFRPSEKYWPESKFTGSDVWNKMYLIIMQWNSCDWGTTKVIIFTGPSKINSPSPFNDKAIDQSHKSHNACSIRQIYHNASFCNRNVHISVTKWCIVGCDTGALWDLCNKSIAIHSQCSATARDHSGYGLIGLNQWDWETVTL